MTILLFIALFAIFVIVDIIFVPKYLVKMWPKRNWTSFTYKLICAAAYIGMCLCAVGFRGGFVRYSLFLLIAFILSFIGDVLLHVPDDRLTKVCFPLGALSFLAAHVFFIMAYIGAQQARVPGAKAFSAAEIIIIAVVAFLAIGACYILGLRFKALLPLILIYCLGVGGMCVKAIFAGIAVFSSGFEGGKAVLALLTVGGVCFLASDFTLALLIFSKKFNNFKLKVFNIVTYFVAQACIAATIFCLG